MIKLLKKILIALFMVMSMLIGFFWGASSGANFTNITTDDKIDKKIKIIDSFIKSEYLNDYDEKKLIENMFKGYVNGLDDPYSTYFDAEEFKQLNEHTSGSFGGIGIQVHSTEGYIEVVSPIKDTPAFKAGVKTGDKIKAVDDKDVSGKELEVVAKLMRGEPGTKVKITVLRQINSKSEIIDFELVREIINVESVFHTMIEGDIGYVAIYGFQERTAEEFMDAVEDLQKNGAKKMVLDLRGNPGGLLNVVVQIADYLLPSGKIMSINYKSKKEPVVFDSGESLNDIPMVTLINKGSASASEILAGALKDYNRSEIVGVNTFGKGVVQQVFNFPDDGTGMKLTVGEFFTPKGNKIQKVGIAPTIEVNISENVKGIGIEYLKEDKQLQKAIEIIKSK